MDNARKFLDAIQQEITLFDGVVVLCILGVRSDGLDNATYSIYSTVQPSKIYEASEFPFE